jgi:hypothetical protein
MHDVHIHSVQPEKLKLKPGSLEKTFEPFDLGFLPEGILAVKLLRRPVVGKGADKKHDPVREQLLAHLREGNPIKEAPVFAKFFYKTESLGELRVVQPTLSPADSMFAGVPVFGAHRVAVRFSTSEDAGAPEFASFSLSEFRQFVTHVAERYGMKDFGQNCGVPLTDTFAKLICHYTDQKLDVLENLDWYQNDPGFELKHIGWKCQGCGLPLSLDGQKKEQIGGKNAKGIAKAQCPKCTQKFGDVKLYSLEKPEGQTQGPGGEEKPGQPADGGESSDAENAPAEAAAQS